MDRTTLLRRLWRHAVWADGEIGRAVAGAPDVGPDVLREYAHLIAAGEVWLARIEGRPPRVAVWPALDRDQAAALGARVRDGYHALLATLTDDALERDIAYVNSAGQRFTTPLGEILTHVALHGHYHRGKLNLLLRQAGASPAPTDYIAFVRGAPAATEATATRPGPAER